MWAGWLRRGSAVVLSAAGVVLLGGAYAWGAPSPAPGAPMGAGVTAWTCTPNTSPAPTTSPSPLGLGTTPVPATTPVPNGQSCAADSYGPSVPLVVSIDSMPPVSVAVDSASVLWPSCSEQGLSGAGQVTPSPAPEPSALRTGSVIGRDCALQADLGKRQAFGLWLFLGALLLLAVFTVTLRAGRRFRG